MMEPFPLCCNNRCFTFKFQQSSQTAFLNLKDGIRFPTHPLPVQLETERVPLGTRVLLQPCPPLHIQTSLLFLCNWDKPCCSVCLIYPEQVCVGQNQRWEPQTYFPFAHFMSPRLCHQTGDTGTETSGSSQVSRGNFSHFSVCTIYVPVQVAKLKCWYLQLFPIYK